jgi:hypothetical protein
MNFAPEPTKGSETLKLTKTALGILDSLRGDVSRSVFVGELLSKEKKRRERRAFYRTALASYTREVRLETLHLNEITPIAISLDRAAKRLHQ